MSDLISREALKEEMVKDLANTMRMMEMHKGDMAVRVLNKIDEATAVDAVEVVRCKDCVHAGAFPNAYSARRFEGGMNCYLCRGDDGYGIANVSVVYPDDYCSDGVKKDGGKQDAERND